jgi:carboxylesterase
MKSLATHFHRKGYTVICPRLANHGQPLEILKYTRWEDFYDSVRKAYLKLETPGPIFTAGLSMGALLSLLLAEEFPERIAGVSCLSPTLFYDGWNVPWTRCLLPLAYHTPLRYFAYFKEEPPYGLKNEALRRRVHEYYKNADLNNLTSADRYGYPFFPVTLFCELQDLIKRLKKVLPRITVPVQLIQAKEDDMTSVKNSEYIHDRVASGMKEIVLLEDSYHVITADQERDKVALRMEGFYERILNPGRRKQ